MDKSGIINIWLTFLAVVIILFLTIIYLLYFQVGLIKNSIKEELYYALMNGQVFLYKDELVYSNYFIDKNKLEENLNLWVKETAKTKININEIKINNLQTNTENSKLKLTIELIVSFKPIITLNNNIKVKINDEIEIRVLELK